MAKNKKEAKKSSLPEAYLLKRGEKFLMVPRLIVEAFTADEAFRLGIVAHLEQRARLLEDAYNGDSYVNDVKIVDGLEISLMKLEEMFPFLRSQIHRVDFVSTHCNKVGRC